MKKIITTIILSAVFFSSTFSVSANNGILWNTLELPQWVEAYKLESIQALATKKFQNSEVQKTYEELQKIDSILRKEFISQYFQGKIEYYKMQDLIEVYGKFIYHAEKAFDYIEMEEKTQRSKHIQNAIYTEYANMRMYYGKLQNIIWK